MAENCAKLGFSTLIVPCPSCLQMIRFKITNAEFNHAIERFATAEIQNRNGEYLVEFAENNNLKIANTFYKKKESKKWTWRSPDGMTKKEIEFILRNDMRVVKDVKCITNLKFPFDHGPLQVTLKIAKRSRIQNYRRSGKTRLDIIPTSVIEKIKEE